MRKRTGLLIALSLFSIARSTNAQNCTSTNTRLCLTDGRFAVTANWERSNGAIGQGQAVPLTSDTGYFWFFNSANVEMVVKVLDACNSQDRFWVFAGGLTNVMVELRVEDTETGAVKTYINPQQTGFLPIQDTDAFATCSGAGGLPPDPGPPGDATLEGIDSDNDGIRDDIQRYIAFNHSDPMMQAAATQMAIGLQTAVLESMSSSASLANADQQARNIECIMALGPDQGAQIGLELLAEVVDTELRGMAYLDYAEQIGGQVFTSRPLDEWIDSCAFPTDGGVVSLAAADFDFQSARQQRCELAPEDSTTVVYYMNGVLNTPEEAEFSRSELAFALHNGLPQGLENIVVKLQYNPSGGAIRDLWETYIQQLGPEDAITFSQFLRLLSWSRPIPNPYQLVFLQLAAASVNITSTQADNLSGQYAGVLRGDIAEGNKVIIVAHSQGNLFANAAYAKLSSEEQQSAAIIAIATPASFVAGGGPYTILEEDIVIDYVAELLPGDQLEPNVKNGVFALFTDWKGHSFRLSYIRPDTESRIKIIEDFKTTRSDLIQPIPIASEGIITVTLTWGAEPDVDLHMYEPNGTHVYFSNKQGPSGFLDVDDTTSFGPEHYFVACDTLETGIYTVGVNYFFGLGPETANIVVEAGLATRSTQVFLPQSTLFGNPILVFDINVTGDQQDGFSFNILRK